MNTVAPRLRRTAAVLGVLPLLLLAGGQGAFATGGTSGSGSESDTPTVGIGGGNEACPSGLLSFKIDDDKNLPGDEIHNGEYTSGGFSVTLSNVAESTFDFSANTVVKTLIVKGGSVPAVVTEPNSKTGSGTAPENDASGGL